LITAAANPHSYLEKWLSSHGFVQQYSLLTLMLEDLSLQLVRGELSKTFHEEVMVVTRISVKM